MLKRKEKGEKIEMKKKIALAFATVMLMTIALFAPSTSAQPPGWPPTPWMDKYIVVGGETQSCVQLWLHNMPAPPFEWNCPFASREPTFTPGIQWENISFSPPIDVTGMGTWVVFLTVPWTSIKSVNHTYFSTTLGYTRVTLLPTGADGFGWIYLTPHTADVDIHTMNFWVPNPNPAPPGVPAMYWSLPVANWTGPSPKAGTWAAAPWPPYSTTYPFPYFGADTLPGFCPMGPGTQDDGFGDGVWDPPGSSILFVPLQLRVEKYNQTIGDFQTAFGGPFILPLTTGTASDIAFGPNPDPPPTMLWINGKNATRTGAPWQNVATTGVWNTSVTGEALNIAKRTVTYVCVWSFLQYFLAVGPPIVRLDLMYAVTEKKVKVGHVIPDVNCDNIVNIGDILTCANYFGTVDESTPAPAGYNPVAAGHSPPWPGPYNVADPAPWLVLSLPNIVGTKFSGSVDLNNDGRINIGDLVTIAINFGATVF